MKKTIILNWKMNPETSKKAKELFLTTKKLNPKTNNAEIVVAAPSVYLAELKNLKNKNLKLGAQNIFWEEGGAFTGEVAPQMLKNLGVEYVIIGHSERRQYLEETDEMVNKKVLTALKAGLKVVLCVGEPLSTRKKGKKAVEKYLSTQLKQSLSGIKNFKLKIKNLSIAYEPIWAIGTGISATPETAAETIRFIKSLVVGRWSLVISVLYGGSVNGKNIKDFIKYKEIDGALVGGASLKKEEAKKIIEIATKIKY